MYNAIIKGGCIDLRVDDGDDNDAVLLFLK